MCITSINQYYEILYVESEVASLQIWGMRDLKFLAASLHTSPSKRNQPVFPLISGEKYSARVPFR